MQRRWETMTRKTAPHQAFLPIEDHVVLDHLQGRQR